MTGLLLTLLLGAPMVEVTVAAHVQEQLGNQVAVIGLLERVEVVKGKGEWAGTALVLDDDTRVYVTYGAPPAGWEPLLGSRVRVEGLLRPSLNDSEPSLLAPHLRAPGVPKKQDRKLKTLLDQRVRLAGLARDAKGGAVLMVDQQPIYLAGLDAWPTPILGQRVVVGGTLVSKQHLPAAKRNEKGEWSQGAAGTQFVFEKPIWRTPTEPRP
jgi:hypothetical protein